MKTFLEQIEHIMKKTYFIIVCAAAIVAGCSSNSSNPANSTTNPTSNRQYYFDLTVNNLSFVSDTAWFQTSTDPYDNSITGYQLFGERSNNRDSSWELYFQYQAGHGWTSNLYGNSVEFTALPAIDLQSSGSTKPDSSWGGGATGMTFTAFTPSIIGGTYTDATHHLTAQFNIHN